MPKTKAITWIRNRVRAFVVRAVLNLQTPMSHLSSWTGGWWWPHETGTGTWQTNTATADPTGTLLTFPAVFACVTGIAQDVAKLRIKLVEFTDDEIWEEVLEAHGNAEESRLIKILNKPNNYQIRIQFVECWIVSKLLNGNAYVLKERDENGRVIRMYVLDPCRVVPLISDFGDVYYQLKTDNLSGLRDSVTVPASEIIHDTMVPLWHPLIGVSPLTACALAATLGNKILNHSTNFFENSAMPGGILTTPKEITKIQADALQVQFETGFGGANRGRIAVLGNDMKFTPLIMTAENAQLADQMKMTREDVAMVFHYPLYKLGVSTPPYANGPQSAQMMYYTDCLQPLMEKLELHLDEGLSIAEPLGTEMDQDGLLRMDTMALYESIDKASNWMELNEQRKRAGYGETAGGNAVYKQQQNYSVEALAKRDASEDPFANAALRAIEPLLLRESNAEPDNNLTDDEFDTFMEEVRAG